MEMTYIDVRELLYTALAENEVETAEHWQMILDKMDEAGVDTWFC